MGASRIPISNSLPLTEQVTQLNLTAQQLGQRLLSSTDRLAMPGCPPTAELIDDLKAYRIQAQQLALVIGADSESDGFSLAKLGELIEVQGLRHSLAIVSTGFAQLSHIDEPHFAPLEHCQREIARLEALVAQSPIEPNAEFELLALQKHPLNSVLRLCFETGTLSDLEWAACHDDVAAHYGRQLATALMRGRIQPNDKPINDADEVIPSVVARDDVFITNEPVDEAETEQESQRQSNSQTIFDDTPSTQTLSAQLRRAAIDSSTLQQSANQLSRAELSNNDTGLSSTRLRGTTTSEAISRLISEDRISLALHLTCCRERQPSQQQLLLPSWLLRALILGRHLNDSRGEIAQQLDDDLRGFHPQQLAEGSDELRVAMSLLTRAAALPAALLAGSTPAVAILRSFNIEPGFSQLYNYCSRVAAAGDRFSEHLVDMFRPAGVISTAAELQDLSLTTRRWLHETASATATYVKTSPLFLHAHWTMFAGTANRHADATALWCQWQEVLSLVQRLLKPVCDQDEGERSQVRQEIARLSSSLKLDAVSVTSTTATSRSSGTLPDPMKVVIQEAVATANRWLRLNHQATSAASQIPPEMLDLRDEIVRRSDAVMAELAQFRQSTTSPLVVAALSCLQNVIHRIRELFESRRTLSKHVALRHVLNGELMRIPGIELNDQWLPESTPEAIEQQIVSHLMDQPLTWRQAFEHHSQLGNHEATARLLEMDVWESTAERESLEMIRQTQIETLRSTTKLELDEVAAELLANTGPESWNSPDVVAIHKRIERLRYDLVRATNLELIHGHINQLRVAVRRLVISSPISPLGTSLHFAAARESATSSLITARIPSQHIFTGE